MSEIQSYVRRQFAVQAVQVTLDNLQEVAQWCNGTVMHDGEKEGNFSRDYIKVRVQFPQNDEQTKARVGFWVVKQGRGFKVYKDKAFRNTFEEGTLPNSGGNPQPRKHQPQRPNNGPSPANMPKKRTEEPKLEAQAGPEMKSLGQEIAVETEPSDSTQAIFPDAETTGSSGNADSPRELVSEAGPEMVIDDGNGMKIQSVSLVEENPFPGAGEIVVEEPDKSDDVDGSAETEVADAGSALEEHPLVEEVERSAAEAMEAAAEMASEPVKPKAITLEELNAQTSDPRSAQEIHAQKN